MPDELFQSEINNLEMNKVEENSASSRLFTSKIHNFENLPEPRNATEGDSEKLPKEFINLQINSNKIIQQQMKRKNIDNDDDEKEIIQQKSKRQNIGDIDVFIVIYLFIRRVLNFPLAIS
ncbi:hypothetical protein RhiirB3_392801 [Rhizophagus irregularis]|nr:hypothetical protein RhiirB3_392801 [Rhizophagus irregularis]